jgi:dihydropyrimidine dehydrogenase (NAD+) subunit PreA
MPTTFAGIRSPNPFWLASAPPTDKAYNVNRAFEAGWGGVVWKTLGEAGPPIVNVNGPRYGALLTPDRRLMGFNNIELITDRRCRSTWRRSPVKRDWPDRAMVVSLMVPCTEERLEGHPAACRGHRAPTASSSTSAARTA